MKIRLLYTLLIILTVLTGKLFAQCDHVTSTEIVDQAVTEMEVVVDGLLIEDLADPDQGLCSIYLSFRHDFIGEVSINLTSPSGQVVNLVGPATSTSGGPTFFTNWAVSMVQCTDVAQPDNSFLSEEFNTLDIWANFGPPYSGSYYPHSGCLEDFNMGSANGAWTFTIEDVSQFGAGSIEYIELVFCDATNIMCFECQADGGTLTQGIDAYCEGDPDLIFDLDPSFDGDEPPNTHDYQFLTIRDGVVLELSQEPDLTDAVFGNYQICGLSYLELQEDTLNTVLDGGVLYADLPTVLDDNRICASLSTNCISIQVVEVPDTILTPMVLCTGEDVTIDGTTFNEAGQYVISFSESFCDSVTILDLSYIDNLAVIDPSNLSLSCTDPISTLSALDSEYGPATIIKWFTDDGFINDTDTSSLSFDVMTPGTYGLSLITDFCTDTAYVTLVNDGSLPEFTFDVDTLTCYDPFVVIDMEANLPLTSISWTGPISSSTEDPLVAVSGTYYITATATNGCTNTDSIFVYEDLDVFDPVILSDTIDCVTDSVMIITTLPDSLSFAYDWSGPSFGVGADSIANPMALTAGTYSLDLQSLDNGCIETFIHEVVIDTLIFPITISADTLTCERTNADLIATSSTSRAIFEWSFAGGSFSDSGDTVSVSRGGVYQAVATFYNGCRDSMSYTVEQDTVIPFVSVRDTMLTCLTDSVQIVSSAIDIDLSYSWEGPLEFESFEVSPFVKNAGDYLLTVRDSAGCSRTVIAQVNRGDDLPVLTFDYDTLNCNILSTLIIPSDTTNLVFDWNSALISDTSAFTVSVEEPGLYPLTVRDSISLCSAEYEIEIIQDTIDPIFEILIDSLDCEILQITPIIMEAVNIDSVNWTSEHGFSSGDLTPDIVRGGEYYIEVTGLNGCVVNKTINIVQDTITPLIDVDSPLLDCQNESVELTVMAPNIPVRTTTIVLPNLTALDDAIYTTSQEGIYKTIVIGDNGCIDSLNFEVYRDTVAPMITLSSTGNISCLDLIGTIIATNPEPGLTYQWSGLSIVSDPTQDSILVDSTGTYSVVVVDTAQCMTTVDFTIATEVDYPIISLDATVIDCANELSSLTLNIPSNITNINWEAPIAIDDDITDIQTDVSGFYMVSVLADNDCISYDTVEVVYDTIVPNIISGVPNIIDCDVDSIRLGAASDMMGCTFEWTSPSATTLVGDTLFVSISGIYDLTVTAPNSCSRDTMIEVLRDTLSPSLALPSDPILNCEDGKVDLSVLTDPDVTDYLWDGPSGQINLANPTVFIPGQYSIVVTNDRGCSSMGFLNVIDDTQGPSITARDTFITCDLLAVPLPIESTDEGVTYLWAGPDGYTRDQKNPLANDLGEYIVFAQLERNSCISADTLILSYQEVPPVYDPIFDNINCRQPNFTLTTANTEDDLSVEWFDMTYQLVASDSLLVIEEDSFNLVVTGTNLCKDTAKVVVYEDFEFPEVDIQLTEPFQCENFEVTLEGLLISSNPEVDYQWMTNDGVILSGENALDALVRDEGTYCLSATLMRNGCVDKDSLILLEEPQSLVDVVLLDFDPKCLGFDNGSIIVEEVIGGFEPFEYAIDGGVFSNDITFQGLEQGDYTITVRDSTGCLLDTIISLNPGLELMIEAQKDSLIIVGDSMTVLTELNVPDEEIALISWSADTYDYECEDCFDPSVRPFFNTIFTVSAETIDGCQAEDQVFISVNRTPTVIAANVIAPSSEGNELFYIQQTAGIERVLSLSIYDRWADRVFHVENALPGDPSAAWDGTFLGDKVNPGVFVILAEILLYSGEVISYRGDLTVLR